MHKTMMLALILCGGLLLGGCSDSGGTGQSAFYHNNREHSKWVNNPSHKPDYRNPNTGGKMFY